MDLHLTIGPIVSLLAGIFILVVPRLLNYIVVVYLIIVGLLGLSGDGVLARPPRRLCGIAHSGRGGSTRDESNQEVLAVRVPSGTGKNVSRSIGCRYELQRADLPRAAVTQAVEHRT